MSCSGKVCPEGTSTASGSLATCEDWNDCTYSWASPCADGEYLDKNDATCKSCPKGHTCILRGTPVALNFGDAGYYSPEGVNVRLICPAGYECELLSGNVPTPCARTGSADMWSFEGATSCKVTSAPKVSARSTDESWQQIDCTNVRGYYNNADNDIAACHVCEPGYYCPYGQRDHYACPPGTWSLGAAEFCHECPPGFECPHTEIPAMNMCLTGWYSNGRQHECTLCEPGFECVGDHRAACPSDMWSLEGEGICKYFLAGVKTWDGTSVFTDCDAG